jgi:hypothetical protein
MSAVVPPVWRHPMAKHEDQIWLRVAPITELGLLNRNAYREEAGISKHIRNVLDPLRFSPWEDR